MTLTNHYNAAFFKSFSAGMYMSHVIPKMNPSVQICSFDISLVKNKDKVNFIFLALLGVSSC